MVKDRNQMQEDGIKCKEEDIDKSLLAIEGVEPGDVCQFLFQGVIISHTV